MLTDSVIFSFIHINKAGGTLFKTNILQAAASKWKWDGSGFGTVFGWNQLIQGCDSRNPKNPPFHNELEGVACGVPVQITPCGPQGGGRCPTRVLWGSHALPLCQLFSNSPCVLAVVLRHPIERVISQYNYVCVEAKEGKKKWSPDWKAANRCPLTLLEFLDRTEDLTSQTFLIDHLAFGANLDVALNNLFHPCMRYLLLSKMSDGLKKLSTVWGPSMQQTLLAVSAQNETRNVALYSSRIRKQMEDPNVLALLREKLKLDISFYELAEARYEEQWSKPLHSCNP